jgi:N-acetylglutamate synthase
VDAAAWRDRLGQRIVVRHRLGGGGLTDVVGELTDVDTHLHVRTRTGPVAVPLHLVVTGKVVPPRPSRKGPPHLVTSITDLEAVASLHWRAEEVERRGGWLLRASGGFTNRANSVLPLAEPRDDPQAELARAVAWYARRGLPARAAVAGIAEGGVPDDGGPAGALSAACQAAGWALVRGGSALVLTAPTAALRRPVELPPGLRLDADGSPDAQWLASYRYRGQPLSPHARPLLMSAPAQAFFSVRDGDGATVAVARGSLGGGWAGLTAVEVAASHRRQGLGGALLAAVADWAWRAGAMSTYLQVGDTNETARQLYARAGFAVHHRYDYHQAPPG